ncbi:TetR/AcrR family transcriptional regulator [Myxococcus sp. CA051A]|uniref:TetR/AcrR family transcriptional regulator n=1 Tax=unclassified Myxococcus TaxID=2648731 RepID=UPI00157B78E7|nr:MULTISPECIES: TetR/AcrR family transcriptional regulator [unclassified Myxococcus]NTX10856.1 TetR/AcrR family transcriptional regulator [Myxococcus sp. CA056]NTX60129.1 TetR/AcrR family transcriptional regulator [Myxococcus sp. CA051A]
MSEPAPKKLPKAQRREQLLDVAMAVVRKEGTDALTLAHLAERAGVSKPIPYEHFQSRAGLLMALYERIDAAQLAEFEEAIQRTRRKLEDVARVMSGSYMHCYLTIGPEQHAISAALKGDGQMETFYQTILDRYVDLYRDALAPYCELPKETLRLRCVGIIGAAEAISRDMLRGAISESTAATTLGSLIVSWLSARK